VIVMAVVPPLIKDDWPGVDAVALLIPLPPVGVWYQLPLLLSSDKLPTGDEPSDEPPLLVPPPPMS